MQMLRIFISIGIGTVTIICVIRKSASFDLDMSTSQILIYSDSSKKM